MHYEAIWREARLLSGALGGVEGGMPRARRKARGLESASLVSLGHQDAWRLGVDRLDAAIEDLTLAYERGWSEIANR